MSVKDYKELEVYRLAFEAAMEIFEKCGYIQEAAHKKLRDKYDHICRQLCVMMKDSATWCHASPPGASRSTLHAPRSSGGASRSTLHAPRASPNAQRSSLNAPSYASEATAGRPRASPNAERSTLNAPRSSAFSLIEVTLAMLVMALGILGVMVLFPAGLKQNERAIADTRAAIFAEEVFGGLRARAEENWDTLSDSPLPVAADVKWDPVQQVSFINYPTVLTNRYTNAISGFENHALRYRLVMTGTNGITKTAALWVWPGEFGTTNDPSVFYAEFFRWQP